MTGFQYSTSSTTASTILYSVLIFLLLIEVQAQRDKQVNCFSSCGEIKNINFPFRLKGDPSGCGDTDYELSCVNNKTILEIFPGKYYVKNISYDNQTLRLVDVNFANGSCGLPSGSIGADGYIKDSRFKGVVENLHSRFRFVKCSKNISQDAYRPVPCLTTNGTYFYTKYDGNYLLKDLERSCSLVSVATVDLHTVVPKLASNEVVMEVLRAGFDVGWSLVCRDCSLSGKSCLAYSRETITYKCGKEHKQVTITQLYLVYVGAPVAGFIVLVVIIVILVCFICKRRRRRNAADSTEKNMQAQQSLSEFHDVRPQECNSNFDSVYV